MPIKTLGSLGKIRVGWVTGNTHIFFLPNHNAPEIIYIITLATSDFSFFVSP